MTDEIKRAVAIGQIMTLREEISRLLKNPAISEDETRNKSIAHADLKLAAVLTELQAEKKAP